jgi:hypothetical protein
VRIVAVAGYIVLIAVITIRSTAKSAAIAAATVFPVAILTAEIGLLAWPERAGAVQLFELVAAVEHIVFYLCVKWPVNSEWEYTEGAIGAQPAGSREAEGELSSSALEL